MAEGRKCPCKYLQENIFANFFPLKSPLSPLENNMKITIEIRGVSKVFKTERGQHVALKDVDLDIRQGEFVSFIGHSDCGKSTLLNLVAGLTEISSGTLEIS